MAASSAHRGRSTLHFFLARTRFQPEDHCPERDVSTQRHMVMWVDTWFLQCHCLCGLGSTQKQGSRVFPCGLLILHGPIQVDLRTLLGMQDRALPFLVPQQWQKLTLQRRKHQPHRRDSESGPACALRKLPKASATSCYGNREMYPLFILCLCVCHHVCITHVYVCICTCVYMYMCVYMCLYVCVYKYVCANPHVCIQIEDRCQSWVVPRECCPPHMLTQALSLAWNLLLKLGWYPGGPRDHLSLLPCIWMRIDLRAWLY